MQRFYINTEGNDDDAYFETIKFACAYSNENPEIERVILLIGTKTQNGWFERIFKNTDIPKRLYTGYKFTDCLAVFKHETVKTFKDGGHDNSVLVISCGLNAKELFPFDDYRCIHTIVAIPWLKANTQKWIDGWHAKELNDQGETEKTYPSDAIMTAMKMLTYEVNLSTDLTHPSDDELAKTYILALHRYETAIEGAVVAAYLKRELGWNTGGAEKIEKLIDTLNAGKSFRGGVRKGLKSIYNQFLS